MFVLPEYALRICDVRFLANCTEKSSRSSSSSDTTSTRRDYIRWNHRAHYYSLGRRAAGLQKGYGARKLKTARVTQQYVHAVRERGTHFLFSLHVGSLKESQILVWNKFAPESLLRLWKRIYFSLKQLITCVRAEETHSGNDFAFQISVSLTRATGLLCVIFRGKQTNS